MPPAVAAGIGGAAALGSGIAGAISSNSAAGKAANTARAGQEAFRELEQYLPAIQAGELSFEELISAGILSPEAEEIVRQQDSEMKGISLDPELRKAQLGALRDFQGIADAGGMDARSVANLAQAQSTIGQQERGSREAILQNAAQRGIGGSGLELAAQLQNQQSAADRMSLQGTQSAADANDRRLAALSQVAGLGGQIRGQDFGEQEKIASAQDAINRFNAANTQDVQMRNVAGRNNAQAQNLAERQRIMDQNVGMRNSQQQYNKELTQRDFENRYKIAQGVGQQAQGAASAQMAGGQAVANSLGGLGQTLAGVGASIYANQPGKKKYDPNTGQLIG